MEYSYDDDRLGLMLIEAIDGVPTMQDCVELLDELRSHREPCDCGREIAWRTTAKRLWYSSQYWSRCRAAGRRRALS